MSTSDWIAALTGGLGFLTGTAAAVIAIRTNKLAKDSNSLSKTANNTAAQALRQAEEANRLAVDANKLAGDANTIAERAVRTAQDDVPYNWLFEIYPDGIGVVVNDCGHPALQVTVVIDCDGHRIMDIARDEVAAFDKITFDFGGALTQAVEHVQELSRVAALAQPVTIRAYLRWKTIEQVPRHDVVEKVFGDSRSRGVR